MRVFPVLLLAFFAIPLIEIFVLINVGQVIGAWWTIAAVVGTAVLGAFLIRAQGVSTLSRIQAKMEQHQIPAVEMFEGLFLFFAGALLMTPGFFTDAIGFACLVPPLRRFLIKAALKRGMMGATTTTAGHPGRESPVVGRTLESEYTHVPDPAARHDSGPDSDPKR